MDISSLGTDCNISYIPLSSIGLRLYEYISGHSPILCCVDVCVCEASVRLSKPDALWM